jgi:hypothetical protein
MKNLTKLSLAVGLALAAAMLNALWLNAKKQPPLFTAAKLDLPVGTELTDEMLTAIPVPGDFDRLRAALIPYNNRAILFGLKTNRAYTMGDMLFQRDIQLAHELPKFEVLGPFRLISVGERFKEANTEREESGIDQGGNNVTIAVSADFDDKTRRLLEIIDPNREKKTGAENAKIVAVQVVPSDDESSDPSADASDGFVYQTVSLEGIENVPRVLLAGDVVRFVVPSSESF